MMKLLSLLIVASVVLMASTVTSLAAANSVGGQITGEDRLPLVGATVTIIQEGSVLTGTATDSDGRYMVRFASDPLLPVIIRVSSIGFASAEVSVQPREHMVVDLVLTAEAIVVPGIAVRPEPATLPMKTVVGKEDLDRRSHYSLVPTNPISAIVEPETVREGSQHSSKIRVNGTVPDYHINGVGIGSDPNHYGTFSIIPGSVVSALDFYPQGTDASYGLPAIINLRTPVRFTKHAGGEVNLSLIEATGSLALGTERAFVLGSLRKSVLDKVIKRLDLEDKRTLPPTNFQDVFVSSGLRLSTRTMLLLDQYHVQDFLSYSTTPSSSNTEGVNMYQHTKESFFGARLQSDLGRAAVEVTASARLGKEIYHAYSNAELIAAHAGYLLDLTEYRRSWTVGATMDITVSDMIPSLTTGAQAEFVERRDTDLQQTNWNYLPPDATSDNLNVYQPELNQLRGEASLSGQEINGSVFTTATIELLPWTVNSGLRLDHFNALDQPTALSFREEVTCQMGEKQTVSLFVGSFAENPVGRVLQTYQVLVRSELDHLEPVRTYLASGKYRYGAVSLGVYGKTIRRQPVLTPNFSRLDEAGDSVEEGFLTMQSTGRSDFAGGDLTLQLDGLLDSRLDLYGFYSYSRSLTTSHGVTTAYNLDAPHKFVVQTNYHVNRRISIGADLGLRSGYPYTPTEAMTALTGDRYTEDYRRSALAAQNSARFPTNASFDLHGEIDFGATTVYLNVANATNRSNPIINTADGFIYDVGILPSLGLRYQF